MLMHAERDNDYDKSVRPSVCLSHCGIVSKRIHISSNSFHHLTLVFECSRRYKIPRETPSPKALSTRGEKKICYS